MKQKDNKDVVKISKRISLNINQGTNEFVPTSNDFQDHTHLLEQVGIAIDKKIPILLVGETGTGKTSLIRYLASKTKNGFRRVNHNGGTTIDDIVGKILINKEGTYWVDGVLVEAMRKGLWYLADEINASSAEINFVYHSLLDDDGFIVIPENGGEIVRPHPNFRFFAGMNPATEYAGTKELNKALLSRFLVVKTDFPPPSVEQKIITSRTGVKNEVAERMIKFAGEVRANHAKGKFSYVLSTRDLLLWATLFKIYGKYLLSAEMAILNKVSNEDLESIKDLAGLHFKSLDTKQTKINEAYYGEAQETKI